MKKGHSWRFETNRKLASFLLFSSLPPSFFFLRETVTGVQRRFMVSCTGPLRPRTSPGPYPAYVTEDAPGLKMTTWFLQHTVEIFLLDLFLSTSFYFSRLGATVGLIFADSVLWQLTIQLSAVHWIGVRSWKPYPLPLSFNVPTLIRLLQFSKSLETRDRDKIKSVFSLYRPT